MATSLADYQWIVESGKRLCDQWAQTVRSIQGVAAFWKGKFSEGSAEPNDNLRGLAFGRAANYRMFRFYVDDASNLVVQQNTGSEAVPNWLTIFTLSGGGISGMNDGTAPSPGFAFLNDLDTGFYRPGANQLGISAGGVEMVRVDTTSLLLPVGAAATPALAFLAESGLGIFRQAAANLGFAITGSERARLNVNSFLAPSGVAATPGLSFLADTDTGLFSQAANAIGVSLGGTERCRFTTAAILLQDGSAVTPSLAFMGDTNVGLYRIGADVLGLTANGAEVARLGTAGLQLIDGSSGAPAFAFTSDTDLGLYRVGANILGLAASVAVRASALGTAALPMFSFVGDPDTGLYSPAANVLALATNGVARVNFDDNGVAIGNGSTVVQAGSLLELTSTTRGLTIPRMTTTQRDAIGTVSAATLIYDTIFGRVQTRRSVTTNHWSSLGLWYFLFAGSDQTGVTSEAFLSTWSAQPLPRTGDGTNNPVRFRMKLRITGTNSPSFTIRIRMGTAGTLADAQVWTSGTEAHPGGGNTVTYTYDEEIVPPNNATLFTVSIQKNSGTTIDVEGGTDSNGGLASWLRVYDDV